MCAGSCDDPLPNVGDCMAMSVVVVFGVCGCGKTTVGRALAEKFQCEFADADDWHPVSNVDKMSRGMPLTDQDRSPWLLSLHELLCRWCEESSHTHSSPVRGVLACSALRKSYRDILSGRRRGEETERERSDLKQCVFVLLGVSESELMRRVGSRKGHFMPASLVQSQLETLEPPHGEELTVTMETDSLSVDEIVMKIIDKLKHMKVIN